MATAQYVQSGGRDDKPPAWLQHARHLPHRRVVVFDILHDVERGDHVELAGSERNGRHAGARQRESCRARAQKTAGRQVEAERAAVGTKERHEVMPGAASAIEQVKVAARAGDRGDGGRDEPAESPKPEMRRLDATGQLEEIVHRSERSRKTSIDQRVLFVRLPVFAFLADAFLTGAFFIVLVFGLGRSRLAGGAFFRLPGASNPPPYRRR